jgi:hypothetical protein
MPPVLLRKALTLVVVAALVAGCSNVGPGAIRNSRFDFNSAIIDTRNEQLLANLVRLRYRDPPYFLEVSSVSTSYSLSTAASASVGGIGDDATGGAGGAIGYDQSPTITYLPLKGDEFVDRLLSPVPMYVIVLLTHSGWRVDRVFRCCVQRVNDLYNAPTASGPTPDFAPEYRGFLEMAELLEEMRQARAIELRYRRAVEGDPAIIAHKNPEGETFVLSLRFDRSRAGSEKLERLKELLGLAPELEEFFLTANPTFQEPSEIGILPRSLIGAMSYLSQAVEPPQKDVDAGRVTVTRHSDGAPFDWTELTGGLFRIRSSADPPDNAFVRIHYRGTWFYIDDSDLTSKASFNLLDQLFQLQAGDAPGASPLLTLSVN